LLCQNEAKIKSLKYITKPEATNRGRKWIQTPK